MSVYIVAEAGVNHNGSLEMAKELARVAKECGADAVKYQTAVPELVISKFAQKAEYQKKTTGEQESQLEMVRRLHFDFAAHKLLHCNTEYPTPYEDANLGAMLDLADQFGLPVGLSDHTTGWECDVAAAALGAVVIEKHFTLDKNLPGPDQKASLNPEELRAMVQAVRRIEVAMGSGKKQVSPSEAKNKAVARKSIVAARPIKKGEVFTTENLTTKRPGDGVSPMRWYEVLGTEAAFDFAEDEPIRLH